MQACILDSRCCDFVKLTFVRVPHVLDGRSTTDIRNTDVYYLQVLEKSIWNTLRGHTEWLRQDADKRQDLSHLHLLGSVGEVL